MEGSQSVSNRGLCFVAVATVLVKRLINAIKVIYFTIVRSTKLLCSLGYVLQLITTYSTGKSVLQSLQQRYCTVLSHQVSTDSKTKERFSVSSL